MEEIEKNMINNKEKKNKLLGIIFRTISIVFIVACIIFYGLRCIKYYKISNPKTVKIEGLVSIEIPKKSPIVTNGSGLYHLNGYYVYKGNVNNNYLLFSGQLFRIVRMRYGGNVQLILDDEATKLYWNKNLTTFDKSNIYDYLNDYFIDSLNKEYMVKQPICFDEFSSVSVKECVNMKEDYVSLIDINTFLNIKDEDNYIAEDEENVWTSNYTSENIWHIRGNNIATTTPDNFYSIKPTIMLDYSINLLGGTGTIDDPYKVDEVKQSDIGKHVLLGEDMWIVVEDKSDNYKLVLANELDKMYSFSLNSVSFDSSEENSLAYYLNNEYFNSLSYKDLIINSEWNVGNYTGDYKSIAENRITNKVGLLSLLDKKIHSESDYYLLNNDTENIYTYSNEVSTTKKTYSKKIRPSIVIKKDSLKDGSGTENDPLKVGV